MKNIEQLVVWKPVNCNKNADTFLFLLLFTTDQREKRIEKNCECRRSKKLKKTSEFCEYFTAISTESSAVAAWRPEVARAPTEFSELQL